MFAHGEGLDSIICQSTGPGYRANPLRLFSCESIVDLLIRSRLISSASDHSSLFAFGSWGSIARFRGRHNNVVFDHGKAEAALSHRKRFASATTIRVGDKTLPFNREAKRWLGGWLDFQLTLKEHDTTRSKRGRNAITDFAGSRGRWVYHRSTVARS